ncbi:MAG: tetratricopeptide repeat protein, partial [Candidatus Latescibacterota bacterium]
MTGSPGVSGSLAERDRVGTSRFLLVLLCLAVPVGLGLVYGRSLEYPFQYDDYHSIVENPHIRSLDNLGPYFLHPEMFSAMPERAMYRPLLLVTYALNHRVGGYRPLGYRLVNLGLHLACAGLVGLLARALGRSPGASLFAAGLFALHPVQVEPVIYLSSRSESLAALGYLGALLAYLYGRGSARRSAWTAVSLSAFTAGLLAKSTVIVLPAAVLLAEWGLPGERSWRARMRRLWPLLAGSAVAGLAYTAVGWEWLGSSLGSPVRAPGAQVWTQAKAAIYYLGLLIMPVRLSVEHGFTVTQSPAAGPVPVALLLLASAAFMLARGSRTDALLAGWAVLPLLPSSLVPLNVLVNDHRLYLTVAFVAIAVAPLYRRVRLRAAWVSGLLLLAILAAQRSAVWQSELSLWEDAVRKGPGMYRAHLHLGGALEKAGRNNEAVRSYERAADLAPEAVEVWYNLGNALRQVGRAEEAAAAYRRALTVAEGYLPALLNLAGLLLDQDLPEEAAVLLEPALLKASDHPELLLQVGMVRRRQGRLNEAEAMYRRTLILRPGWGQACYALANLCFDSGRLEEAARYYETAL